MQNKTEIKSKQTSKLTLNRLLLLKCRHNIHNIWLSLMSGGIIDVQLLRALLLFFTVEDRPLNVGSFSHEGTHTFTSQSRPLVQMYGTWGWGSKQFTYNFFYLFYYTMYEKCSLQQKIYKNLLTENTLRVFFSIHYFYIISCLFMIRTISFFNEVFRRKTLSICRFQMFLLQPSFFK